jgi:8-oxo-dGTP pyrophosphatase MutT (NUDIX family)
VAQVCCQPGTLWCVVYDRLHGIIGHVAGFLFSHNRNDVALTEKIYPEWQRDQLYGIGGKIEPSDASPTAAMIREFEE